MLRTLHVAAALAAWLLLWRGLGGASFVGRGPDPALAEAFALAVLLASAAGSLAAIAAGRSVWSPKTAALADLVSLAAAFWAFGIVVLGSWTSELGGLFLVLIVAVRLAPGALAVASGRAPAGLAFAVALSAYAALAAWSAVASLPLRDEVHSLLVADRLRNGQLTASIDEELFRSFLGVSPDATDVATQVAQTPSGSRPAQGYVFPLLLVPGWALAGRLGAHLVLPLAAAWASLHVFLILRDVLPRRAGLAGRTWLLASFLAPLPVLAAHLYPSVVGAALTATAYRAGFTAPIPRPALAAGLLALGLFLTPMDGLTFLVLMPLLLRLAPAIERGRAALVAGAVAFLAVLMNVVLYGLPIPYAGYLIASAQAAELPRDPASISPAWVGLPAVLFDRTRGLAGIAPWAFVGVLGLAGALRADRERLLPAALALVAAVMAVALVRPWEGSDAPPLSHLVGPLLLWAPFAAYGLRQATAKPVSGGPQALALPAGGRAVGRGLIAVVVGVSALATLVLAAIPSMASASPGDRRLADVFERILGVDPLGWLPSLEPASVGSYFSAYASVLAALAIAAALLIIGLRAERPDTT